MPNENRTELFVVFTGNRFNQIMIFASYQDAHEWLRRATRLTEEQIANEIRGTFYRSDCKYWTSAPSVD